VSTPHPSIDINGGWIGFGPDGYPYAAVGDSGKQAQDPNSRLNKMLRVRVARAGSGRRPMGGSASSVGA
jgi:glucose/arabinose dehydrogenase